LSTRFVRGLYGKDGDRRAAAWKKVNALRSASVARRDIAGKSRPFLEEAVNDEVGGRRTIAIGLLVGLIAAVEASNQAVPALGGRLLGFEQALHLAAPAFPFLLAAQGPEIMQRAENFGEAREIALIARRRLGRFRRGGVGLLRVLLRGARLRARRIPRAQRIEDAA